MSNLSGNYKISAGEVQGVDVVREQERRARLQLLDEIREPSPQPIFGEPVKVELEDETSRRIKNTLGDFTQVLIPDSKALLGIARQSSSTSGHGAPQGGKVQVATKRPQIANGMYKPSPSNIPKHPAPDKRLGYPRNKPHEPPIICPPNSFYNNNNNAADSRLKDPTQWQNSHLQRKPGAPQPLNGNSQNVPLNPSYRFNNPSYCPNNSSSVPSNKTHPFQVNGMVSNTVSQAPRYSESSSSAPPPKRPIFRPSIKLPERVWKPEKPAESPIELETILREMAVPPPLTAIQTPRKEECGFSFSIDPKEDVLSSKVKEQKLIKTPEPVPQPPDPQKSKEIINSRQSTPSPCISSSLHDDLEMSESDDEVQEIKVIPAGLPKSPVKTPGVIPNDTSTPINNSMDAPKNAADSSSSSESGDSDSDDSSSESNDSDSSASSEDEASDADTPSKMWGLSNFFDESRRIHSPAFVAADNCTNSSTTAAKENPVIVPANPKESSSLVDDDPGNGTLRDPLADPVPNLLELESPVNIKSEVLSPITSPFQPLGPPAQPPPSIIRGPRTPPSPSSWVEEAFGKSCITSISMETEMPPSVPNIQISKPTNFQENTCDTKEDTGKMQMATAKKPRLSKNKSEIFSPRTESSPVIQSVEDDPSASKGMCDASLDKDNDITTNSLISSCSVPSETSKSSHKNYSIKTRQKILKSSNTKKAKCVSEESLSESGQKGNKTAKSPAVSKFKHPTRTCRALTETKQLSNVVTDSIKPDPHEEVKKPLNKYDIKDKSNSEKTKVTPKTVVNTKGLSKNSVKIKKKPQKISPKQISEGKKSDIKRKKNKFHIENFLQSPTISQSETGHLSKVSPVFSPSLDKSPAPDFKISTDIKKKPNASPRIPSQSPSKLTTKSTSKTKNGEKLRRSARCSERASSIAQAEASETSHQDSDMTKKSIKRTPKLKEQPGSPCHLEASPSVLPPIPHFSPLRMRVSECSVPLRIMVCIPLNRLSRLPLPVHVLDSDIKFVSKSKLPPVETNKKSVLLLEKPCKTVTNKSSVSKDIKDKPRTVVKAKANKNKSPIVATKDKHMKTVSEPSLTVKSKTASSVNNKTSIKATDASETKNSKKRKSEGEDKQLIKKKPKPNPELSHDRIQLPTTRTDSPCNQTDASTKSKGLERCDSVSSLSSLSSQISQRSSKEKKSSMADGKRVKSSLPVKHIKQEKEEKLKTTIKKEPGTADKSKEKSRDKLISKDVDQKPLLEPLWSDTSSQYCSWDDPCKDDPKDPLPITNTLQTSIIRSCGFDWDHFGSEMSKDMKDSSNKHNNPIMPMDYYYTEGRKQRHLAEREKDPFLQTLKYFEATVLFILTSQQREEYTKEPESVYQYYRETLNFSHVILQNVRIQQASPGDTEFKLLILILRCQALLHVKLYSLKIKEIKEQQKNVSDFFMMHCPHTLKNLSHPTPQNPRNCLASIPSPISPTPSPASSVNSQTSGYSSSDVSGNHMRSSLSLLPQSVNVTQSMLENLCRQHTHLINLHKGHDLWEQADMYMTRSNLREFFKEVADQSENLTLHSSIKDLVDYVQTGISLVKKCSR